MRPEDLKSPFKGKPFQILLQDQVWYVPDLAENKKSFVFPGWDHPTFFERPQPICLEYCSGNGAWIAARAQVSPHYNWVAIEWKFDRVRKILAKIKNHRLSNVLAVCGEGDFITRTYLPSESVQAVYINFPDPWPKRRHAKQRLIQIPFIQEIERILVPGGPLTLVTDEEVYSNEMIACIRQVPRFQSLYPPPYYCTDYPGYGSSYFEDLWRQKGKVIRYHSFSKTKNL